MTNFHKSFLLSFPTILFLLGCLGIFSKDSNSHKTYSQIPICIYYDSDVINYHSRLILDGCISNNCNNTLDTTLIGILDTNLKNERAQYVYEKLGFKKKRINVDSWKNQIGELQSSVDYAISKEEYMRLYCELSEKNIE